MAVDTRNKRASALACGLAFLTVLPAPDGLALDKGDRQQTAALYRGIEALATSVLDLCETDVVSLNPVRRVVSLMPTRTVVSLGPVRRVVRHCHND